MYNIVYCISEHICPSFVHCFHETGCARYKYHAKGSGSGHVSVLNKLTVNNIIYSYLYEIMRLSRCRNYENVVYTYTRATKVENAK